MLKYIFLTTELTGASIDKVVSRAAPRFLTVGLAVNITSPPSDGYASNGTDRGNWQPPTLSQFYHH